MRRIQRLLVPVDFSDGSRAALEYAIMVAEQFGASLDILHVWEVPHLVGMDMMLQMPNFENEPLDQYVRAQAERELAQFVQQHSIRDDIQVAQRLKAGDVEAVIAQIAQRESFDLIVMGTHGRTGLAHLLMGSVAERVLRVAPCPVLTIREGSLSVERTHEVHAAV